MYSVQKGHTPGVFATWEECKASIHGFPGAVYKKCKTREEAEAFASQCAPLPSKHSLPTLPTTFYVYTDGACSNNGSKHAKAGIGVWFAEGDSRNVSQPIAGKQSNNTAELHAILRAMELVEADIRAGRGVCIMTDSKYSLLCLTSYGDKCAAECWKREIPNKDLVRQCYETYRRLAYGLTFQHVDAHTGRTDVHSVGNDGADRLANQAIGLTSCPYSATERVYLTVPFAQKEVAKSLGARWDPETKSWWGTDKDVDLLTRFRK
jgi:ribonuclease HI